MKKQEKIALIKIVMSMKNVAMKDVLQQNSVWKNANSRLKVSVDR